MVVIQIVHMAERVAVPTVKWADLVELVEPTVLSVR